MSDPDPDEADSGDEDAGAAQAPRKSNADPARAILAALGKVTRPATPAELAASTGLSEATVRRTLGRLVSLKDARRAGGDRYTSSRHPR